MKYFMPIILIIFSGLLTTVQGAETLDQLMARVHQEAGKDRHFDRERERRFIAERNSQQTKLNRMRAELNSAQTKADAFREEYQSNETRLEELDKQISSQAGELNELLAMVQQNSAEIGSLLDRSMISAQYPERGNIIDEVIHRDTPVSMDTMKKLWLVLLDEIHETGKVVRFSIPIITLDGEEKTKAVTRVGSFNATSEGKFLRYLPDTRKLVELARQPAMRFQRMAQDLEQAQEGWEMMAVDPSKGAILALLVQSPDFSERLDQSGAIGYLILAIGAIGLLIVIWRGTLLLITTFRVKRQLANTELKLDNPLGKLISSFKQNHARNSEALAASLDDAVAQESSRLFFGLTALTVFASVTPLLGLLGTVIGMIDTFQSISLFGTGDPKLMAGGISYALVTTQLGLAVAIPLLLMQSFLHAQANRVVEILDQQSASLFESYEQKPVEAG